MPFRLFQKHQTSSVSPITFKGSVWLRILLFFTLVMLCFGGWFLWKIHATGKRISVTNNSSAPWATTSNQGGSPSDSPIALRQDDQGIINILLLGIAGEHKPGNLLTDTLIVLRIDTKNHRAGLLSLPRDLLVPVDGENGPLTKINSLYPISYSDGHGADYTKKAVSLVTGLPIHFFVVVNFDGFRQVIDAIGGISVFVERDILDTRYPGPNYSYETFSLSRGWQTLDGDTALKYARERHNDPEGDFGRAKRQQNILQAVKDKILSVKTLANPFALNRLFDAVGDNIRTDITPEEIPTFLEIAQSIDTRTLSTAVVDAWKADSLLRVAHVPTSSGMMFALVPRTGNWNETRDLAGNVFDLENLRRHQEAILTEQPSLAIVNRSGHADYADRFRRLLSDQLGFQQTSIASEQMGITQNESALFDTTNGAKPWSLDSLIKKLPLTLASDSHNQPLIYTHPAPDIIVVLGKNMESVFQYDDASREEYQQQSESMENN